MIVSQKLELETTYDPFGRIPLLAIYPRTPTQHVTKTLAHHAHSSSIMEVI